MVAALSVLTVWMLLGTWRHMRRRLQMQDTLISEANFRRAMENSMLTGMRAMDMDGVITYVNPAFCAMTGFSEAETDRRPAAFSVLATRPPRGEHPAAATGTEGPQPGRRHRGQGDAQGRLAVRLPHVRLAADRSEGNADRLDDVDDQHHRGQAHPRPAVGIARALHDRARRPGCRGLGDVGPAGRTAVREPLVPALVRRRRAGSRADGRRRGRRVAARTPPTTRSTTSAACRPRRSPTPGRIRARCASTA